LPATTAAERYRNRYSRVLAPIDAIPGGDLHVECLVGVTAFPLR
jgi:hypothetical protein